MENIPDRPLEFTIKRGKSNKPYSEEEEITQKSAKKKLLRDAQKALQKNFEEIISTTDVLPTKYTSGGTCQTPVKKKASEPASKQNKLRKIIPPVYDDEEEIQPLKRKSRQQVDIVKTSIVLASDRLVATTLVEHAN